VIFGSMSTLGANAITTALANSLRDSSRSGLNGNVPSPAAG
jgi:hypothetical protein